MQWAQAQHFLSTIHGLESSCVGPLPCISLVFTRSNKNEDIKSDHFCYRKMLLNRWIVDKSSGDAIRLA